MVVPVPASMARKAPPCPLMTVWPGVPGKMIDGALVPGETVPFHTGFVTEQTNVEDAALALIAAWREAEELNEMPPPGFETARAPAPERTEAAPSVGPYVG